MPFDDTIFLKKTVDVLSFFNEDQLRRVTPDIERRSYGAGQTLIMRGEINTGFHIVKQGSVTASYKTENGPRQTALKAGDFFGAMTLLEDAASDATIKASENDTVVLTIPAEAFRKLLEMQPLLKQSLLAKVAERRKAG